MSSMQVILNDQPKQLSTATSLNEALQQWGYQQDYFAVAVNQQFVPREQYADINLKPDDCIDVVTPMQGG